MLIDNYNVPDIFIKTGQKKEWLRPHIHTNVDRFFLKDKCYANEFEWRIVLLGENGNDITLENDDHYILNIEPIEVYKIGNTIDILNSFSIIIEEVL
ncbi:hypothetical protein SDC9_90891 [bioreactor metagenome]|uniref:Uncharacterized protein n=1 Tax=bioreactor metagenome TaxID=1076179 RepID=A0A645A035_9ZZZZ|nr:hypothetical protein [Oscillospiraceae bacterium]